MTLKGFLCFLGLNVMSCENETEPVPVQFQSDTQLNEVSVTIRKRLSLLRRIKVSRFTQLLVLMLTYSM